MASFVSSALALTITVPIEALVEVPAPSADGTLLVVAGFGLFCKVPRGTSFYVFCGLVALLLKVHIAGLLCVVSV